MDATRLTIANEQRQRAKPRRFRFTEANLKAIKPPTDKDKTLVYDTDVGGLAFGVTNQDGRSFYYIRKYRGRIVKQRLGAFNTMNVKIARERAQDLNAQYAKNIDAIAIERRQRNAGTLGELWEKYKAAKLDPKATAKTIKSEVSLFNTTLKPWANREIHAIDHDACERLHADIGEERGERTANRALKMLSRLYAWQGTPAPFNTKRIEWFKERSRDRELSADEIRRLMMEIDRQGGDIGDALKMLAFTGARRDNVASMAWAEVDLKSAVWTIPGNKSKNRDDMSIPLTPPALALLKARQKNAGECPHVFPHPSDPTRHTPGHDVWKHFKAIREAAEVSDVYVHDFRHLMGNTMTDGGANLQTIGKGLGHKSTESTKVYARPRMAAVRAAMTAATDAILKASKPKGGRSKKEK